MSAGANFAASIAAEGSFAYLAVYHICVRRKAGQAEPQRKQMRQTFLTLSKTILRLSVPVSVASIITSMGRVIDTATISRGITAAFAGGIPGQSGIPDDLALSQEVVRLMGMLSKGDSILNLPLALNTAFMTMLVPSVARLLVSGSKEAAIDRIEESMRMTVLLILPCSVGPIVLAQPIYRFIYPNAPLGWELLQMSAVGMFLVALNQTVTGGLQGLGHVSVPAKALFCGVAVKVTLNFLLIRIPAVNIYGAPVATAACYLTAFWLEYCQLRHIAPLHHSFPGFVVKTALCAGIMGVAAKFGYQALHSALRSSILTLFVTIAGSAVLYFLLLFAFHQKFKFPAARR